MANDRFLHPRRAGIGDALARAIPLPQTDAEAKLERQLLHRLELRERVLK